MTHLAYTYDNTPGALHLPHNDPSASKPVSKEDLAALNIHVIQIPHSDGSDVEAKLKAVAGERGFENVDVEVLDLSVGGVGGKAEFEKKRKETEGHEYVLSEETINVVLQGKAYADFRDKSNGWIRIPLVPGYIYIWPPGAARRAVHVDDSEFRVMRVVKGEPGWRGIERSKAEAEKHPARMAYVQSVGA
ncbi:hypothetical protein E1B28_005463 [Marasmius oreades]|uniref:acireductone dioxygenase (Fe(2+)-requiring) n=1 Tax=Marasmius oreades TaxID=181124 RepID=A0A9P7UW55_9AGAR|nr:uncharacterized protein E1B28_005463 [Marasmius oreades]KAG7094639.1 hypothetical protein E1B28_005463 [Marasmius oreades]